MKNRLKKANANHRYRFKLRHGLTGDASDDDYVNVFMMSGGLCEYCGKKLKLLSFHVDLIMPLYRNGEHKRDNLAIACPKCNKSKGYKHPARFASEQVSKGIVTKRNLSILNKHDMQARIQLSLPLNTTIEIEKAA